MRYRITFRGKLLGAIGISCGHFVTTNLPDELSRDEIIYQALYMGVNDNNQKYEHIEHHTISIERIYS